MSRDRRRPRSSWRGWMGMWTTPDDYDRWLEAHVALAAKEGDWEAARMGYRQLWLFRQEQAKEREERR